MTTIPPAPEAIDLPTDSHEAPVYVLGDGPLGAAVARRLRAAGREVVPIDGRSVEAGDTVDVAALTAAGLAPDATVVVATASDARNLLVAQLLRTRFDVDRVIVLTHRPDRVELVADAGHEAVCATDVLSEGLADRL